MLCLDVTILAPFEHHLREENYVRNTILLILVTTILLGALAARAVPQPYHIVQGRSQNKAPVRSELHISKKNSDIHQ